MGGDPGGSQYLVHPMGGAVFARVPELSSSLAVLGGAGIQVLIGGEACLDDQ